MMAHTVRIFNNVLWNHEQLFTDVTAPVMFIKIEGGII